MPLSSYFGPWGGGGVIAFSNDDVWIMSEFKVTVLREQLQTGLQTD